MRLIKLAILSFIILFAIITAFSLMIPSRVRISRAINVLAPRDTLLQWAGDTTRWKAWHPAYHRDSVRSHSPIALRLVSRSDSEVVVHMQQQGRRGVTSGWKTFSHASTDSVTLQWYLDFKLQWYPWQKFGSLFYESTYGAMMEQGLGNIKTLAERDDTYIK